MTENNTVATEPTPVVDEFKKQLQERIDYLIKTEFECLNELDGLKTKTLERDMKWRLINELCVRRQELQDAMKLYEKCNQK